MDIVTQIKAWAAEELEDGLFVVDVEWKQGSRKIVVSVDGDQPVNIEQCRKLARHLSARLDENDPVDGAYQLEVSTPGVDRPLKMFRQYAKHVGRELKVKLKSNTELLGRLESAEGEQVSLLLKDKKKGFAKGGEPKLVSFDDIDEAWVQVSFR
jgi:ribosome maturation factor RimP